jgi:hypothetical protein
MTLGFSPGGIYFQQSATTQRLKPDSLLAMIGTLRQAQGRLKAVP